MFRLRLHARDVLSTPEPALFSKKAHSRGIPVPHLRAVYGMKRRRATSGEFAVASVPPYRSSVEAMWMYVTVKFSACAFFEFELLANRVRVRVRGAVAGDGERT
ncbi:hypothetical protein GSI_10225 [Ganoderma sinense ZZ0214-1]|uniref:Uncharacterized protein n=1 Tax=Ganoderma sinense ZZ0214-1 TaxID=1077348 RepID=A0A2G8RZZ3_9APHY|nr:hypothetical protein GSI_10225 [Ganoderma sinense ZZ0214-1]